MPPQVRVTQQYTEVVVKPSAPVRVTQQYTEVVVKPSAPVRVTQQYTEVVVNPAPPLRVTQTFTEVVVNPAPPLRVTQTFTEVLVNPAPPIKITQSYIEVILIPGVKVFQADIAPAVDSAVRSVQSTKTAFDVVSAILTEATSRYRYQRRDPGETVRPATDVAVAIVSKGAPVPAILVLTPEIVSKVPQRLATLQGARGDYWASDIAISMPKPKDDRPVLLDLGGYGFTTGGITINVTDSEVDEVFTAPFFTPEEELVDA